MSTSITLRVQILFLNSFPSAPARVRGAWPEVRTAREGFRGIITGSRSARSRRTSTTSPGPCTQTTHQTPPPTRYRRKPAKPRPAGGPAGQARSSPIPVSETELSLSRELTGAGEDPPEAYREEKRTYYTPWPPQLARRAQRRHRCPAIPGCRTWSCATAGRSRASSGVGAPRERTAPIRLWRGRYRWREELPSQNGGVTFVPTRVL